MIIFCKVITLFIVNFDNLGGRSLFISNFGQLRHNVKCIDNKGHSYALFWKNMGTVILNVFDMQGNRFFCHF
jgi:hypothetical protein